MKFSYIHTWILLTKYIGILRTEITIMTKIRMMIMITLLWRMTKRQTGQFPAAKKKKKTPLTETKIMNWNTYKKTVYSYKKDKSYPLTKKFIPLLHKCITWWVRCTITQPGLQPVDTRTQWWSTMLWGRSRPWLAFRTYERGRGGMGSWVGRAVSSIETLAYVVLYIGRTLLKLIKSHWRVKPGRTAGRKSGGAPT